MKTGILSILLALTGIAFVIWYNDHTAKLFMTEFMKMKNGSELSLLTIEPKPINKVIALAIALLALFFGIISIPHKNQMGLIGILLSIFLIVLVFVPIWTYLISDSALDIHLTN